jgi:hypothetical protein
MSPPTERELAIRAANLPGWHLIGVFYEPDFPGSWLLHNGREALLLELPPEMPVDAVTDGLASIGSPVLRYVTASHSHEDHLDPEVWNALIDAYPDAEYLSPNELEGDTELELGGEPVWLIKAPKHSPDDVVIVFRGVAMTGDIETTMLRSVNDEVPRKVKAASMDYLREFPERTGYHVHTTVSAHLNSLRHNVDWRWLFTYHD